jgi:hypothetical protein
MVKRDEEREKRLAAALRENLKRRKAQAREGAAPNVENIESPRQKPGPMTTESEG